jgi:hypothetical protein
MRKFFQMGLAILVILIACVGSAHAERLWSHTLHDGRDPFSPPHTRMDCVNWAYPWPGAKICVGHRVQCRYIKSKFIIWVDGPTAQGAREKAQKCGDDALRAGLLAAAPELIATLGAKGWDTFLATSGASFKACVISIGASVNAGYDNPVYREENWGGC